MANVPVSFICSMSIILGFAIFYFVAIAESTEVSEIGCAKVMWYTVCIGTGNTILGGLFDMYKRNQVQQLQEQLQAMQSSSELNLESPFSPTEMGIGCLVFIGALVNCSLLLDQVLNIDSECKAAVEKYNLFWIAAQMQAYLFLSFLGISVVTCCCHCCFSVFMWPEGTEDSGSFEFENTVEFSKG